MRCMVKINDLEEKVEPLLSGMMGASTSGNPWDSAMEVEESVGLRDEARLAAHFSPGGVAVNN